MARPSSVAVKIKYAHVAKDGRTPIYNAVSKEWTYHDSPSFEQLNTSAIHLKDISSNALSAITKADSAIVSADTAFSKASDAHSLASTVQGVANTAQNLAATAQQTADLKVTAEEAVEEARNNMFVITPLPKNGMAQTLTFRTIEFLEVTPGAWTVWINLDGDGQASSSTRGWLDYADNETVDDLLSRVAAIEQRLGIS